MEVIQKSCTKCLIVMDLDCFGKQQTGKHGRQSRCRKCIAENAKQKRANMSYDMRQEMDQMRNIAYQKRNPVKKRINNILGKSRMIDEEKDIYDKTGCIKSTEVLQMLEKCKYSCEHCDKDIMKWFNLSTIDDTKGHISGNCKMACIDCVNKKDDGGIIKKVNALLGIGFRVSGKPL